MLLLHTRALFASCTLSVLIWSSLFFCSSFSCCICLALVPVSFSVLLIVSVFLRLSSCSVLAGFLVAFVLPLSSMAVLGDSTAGGHLSAEDLCYTFDALVSYIEFMLILLMVHVSSIRVSVIGCDWLPIFYTCWWSTYVFSVAYVWVFIYLFDSGCRGLLAPGGFCLSFSSSPSLSFSLSLSLSPLSFGLALPQHAQ